MLKQKILLTLVFSLVLLATAAYGGAVLRVNSSSDGETCDGVLTLAEAAHLGRGNFGRPLTNGEKNQISGGNFVPFLSPPPPAPHVCGDWIVVNGLGENDADDIVFDAGITSPITYGISLGKNDDIDGTIGSTKVILNGSGQAPMTHGIRILDDSGSQVRNLVIRNFPGSGIFAQRLNGAKFEGLDIFGNGTGGMSFGFNGGINCRNVTIGGDLPQHRNRIFSNGGDGILIVADPARDRSPSEAINILNNLIGTSDGITDNGNAGRGITLTNAFGVTIGSATTALGNTISGNESDGIALIGSGAVSNVIFGNFIGTDSRGLARLGNTASGVALLNDAGDSADFVNSFPNRIGQPGGGFNIICANNSGIFIADPNTSNNIVQGNFIGTNGKTDLGNNGDGIFIVNGTFDNQIGGANPGEENWISYNGNGIKAVSGARNSFRRNRIFSNDNMGIDLIPVGFTANDVGDVDNGPNNLQNFPVITYVNAQSNSVTIQGTLSSTPNRSFKIDLFGNDALTATGFAEGKNFLGSTDVQTNSGGNAAFNKTITVSLGTVGRWVTAIATDLTNNTSEFSQARNICADVSISPSMFVYGNGGLASFTVTTAPGCTLTAQSNSPWMEVISVSGSTVNFRIFPNASMNQRTGSINVYVNQGNFTQSYPLYVFQLGGGRKPFFDFDGDMKTDVSVFSPSNNSWEYIKSTNQERPYFYFGQAGDQIVPADYTGDGRTDIAVFRPSDGNWYILPTGGNPLPPIQWGASGDIPAPGDFDYDGKADVAVYRPSETRWYIAFASGGMLVTEPSGNATDIPQVNDYDGDGKADIAVFRPTDGTWRFKRSSDSVVVTKTFGNSTFKPVAADYTGDGKADLAVWRPSTGDWYVLKSEDLPTISIIHYQYGVSGDIPVAGDYDGDGRADFAIFRSSTTQWYLQRTTAGEQIVLFGKTGDKPVPSAFVP